MADRAPLTEIKSARAAGYEAGQRLGLARAAEKIRELGSLLVADEIRALPILAEKEKEG